MIAGVATSFAQLPAPVLEPFDGATHTSSHPVKGKVDLPRPGSKVRILRNDVVVDSASTTKADSFLVRIPLVPGDNTITAVAVVRTVTPTDTTIEISPPSNAIHVNFVETGNVFIPVPFPPGGSFDLNAGPGGSGAELRVFDMAGDEVVRFENRNPRTYYSFVWNGLNGGGEAVRRGPLIAVAIIHHVDGTKDVKRRAFLFDPGAAP